jgi:hypothetical protein
MKSQAKSGTFAFALASFLVGASFCANAQSETHGVRNVTLVHGAWADGAGWRDVYDILSRDGYAVNIVQEPETSFAADVAATRAS